MKNDYPELNFDMEHLLQNKKYEDLTPEELNEISDFISSKEDYMLMQNTFLSVKTSLGEEEEIIPDQDTKSRLMEAFESKHGKVISISKPRPFYLNPLFQVGVAAVFILGIVFFYPSSKNDEQVTAMNESNKNKDKVSEDGVTRSQITEEENTESEAGTASLEQPAVESADEISVLETNKTAEALKEETVSRKEAFLNNNATATKVMEAMDEDIETLDDKSSKFKVDMNRSKATVSKTEEKREDLKPAMSADVAKADDSNSFDAVVFSNSTTNTSTTNGAIATVEKDLTSAEKSKKKDSDKKTSEGEVRKNSIGGRYYQPAPAMDMKVGVSLNEKPELASFLFTAL